MKAWGPCKGARAAWIAALLTCGAAVGANEDPPTANRPSKSITEQAILDLLARDPVTSGYPVDTLLRRGRVVLHGRVGTHAVHDAVVGAALSVTPAIVDELVIDTGEVYRRTAGGTLAAGVAVGMVPGGVAGPDLTSGWIAAPPGYVYPPPLFGRIDDPFFGLEPPVISYPPWWGRLTVLRRSERARALPRVTPQAPAAAESQASKGDAVRADDESLEMELDEAGVATVTGKVGSEEAKAAVIRELERTPGVQKVVDRIQVAPRPADGPGAPSEHDERQPVPAPPEPGDPLADDGSSPERAGADATGRVAAAGGAAVQVVGGVAYLSGRVSDVVEAMRRFCEAAATPGVRVVNDRLEFPLHDGRKANPLLAAEPRADVETYLAAQLRRHLGEAIALDAAKFEGDALIVRGSVADVSGISRALAVVRSMAILRGIEIEPSFVVSRR